MVPVVFEVFFPKVGFVFLNFVVYVGVYLFQVWVGGVLCSCFVVVL